MKEGERMALLSIKEIAEKYDVTTAQVRYAIQQGRISCKKVGWVWVCPSEELPDAWPITLRQKLKIEGK